jgi:hypothetical protein
VQEQHDALFPTNAQLRERVASPVGHLQNVTVGVSGAVARVDDGKSVASPGLDVSVHELHRRVHPVRKSEGGSRHCEISEYL